MYGQVNYKIQSLCHVQSSKTETLWNPHTYPRFQEVSGKLLDCCQVASLIMDTVYSIYIILFRETYCCVWHAVHPSKDIFVPGLHSVQHSDIWQMDFSGIGSLKLIKLHFKLAYIDLALNLALNPHKEKYNSTRKEHQNSLRKFAIWGSQFSELWPLWMILQQSQIQFFILNQNLRKFYTDLGLTLSRSKAYGFSRP